MRTKKPAFGTTAWGIYQLRLGMIQMHATFACPVSGEILDIDESVLVGGKDGTKLTVISKNGLNKLIERHGQEKIEKILYTEADFERGT